jgi:hypothetical protein
MAVLRIETTSFELGTLLLAAKMLLAKILQ